VPSVEKSSPFFALHHRVACKYRERECGAVKWCCWRRFYRSDCASAERLIRRYRFICRGRRRHGQKVDLPQRGSSHRAPVVERRHMRNRHRTYKYRNRIVGIPSPQLFLCLLSFENENGLSCQHQSGCTARPRHSLTLR